MVDARLEDGSRVNIAVRPISVDGPLVSIRKFSKNPYSLERLMAFNSIRQPMIDLLRIAVQARKSILVSGGTGSGKTTLLNALSNYIPARERLITIEDAAELQLQQPHVGRLETRPPNVEGKGEVRQRELVKNALRMRPDRIIVGEVRGEEAFDMLQAMNTGHEGSMTTIHANTPRDAISRLEQMVGMAGMPMTHEFDPGADRVGHRHHRADAASFRRWQARRFDLRTDRHGRQCRPAAGNLPFRPPRRDAGGHDHRRVPRHRRPPALCARRRRRSAIISPRMPSIRRLPL